MTEQFKQWVEDVCIKDHGMDESWRGHFDCNDTHFWLRAFVREVERRTKWINREMQGPNTYIHPDYPRIEAYKSVVRDFGLDKTNE